MLPTLVCPTPGRFSPPPARGLLALALFWLGIGTFALIPPRRPPLGLVPACDPNGALPALPIPRFWLPVFCPRFGKPAPVPPRRLLAFGPLRSKPPPGNLPPRLPPRRLLA